MNSNPTSSTAPVRPPPTAAQTRAARIQIVLMLLVFAAPVVMSYVWYFLVHPTGGRNYGTLLDVHPLPSATLTDLDGKPASLDALRGKWLLVAEDAAACDAGCAAKLYAMRQIRAALGHDDSRVERVLLLEDGKPVSPAVLQDYAGTHFLRLQGAALQQAFTPENGQPHDHLWVVDPLGNLVMRYPPNPDLKRLLKDMERLLKASQIG